VEERWWDGSGRRRARFQMGVATGAAYLVAREGGRWWVEATYD
jgi:protein ImuB